MILVDYKGGAAFAPFAGLPHVAGLIDNLADDAAADRAGPRVSIAGEVVRRQQLLADAGSLAVDHPLPRAARAAAGPAADAAPVRGHRRVRRAAHRRARLRRPALCDRAHRPLDRRAPAAVQPAHRVRPAARPGHLPVVPDRPAHVLRGRERGRAGHPRRVPPAGRARATATSRSTPASTRASASGYVSGPARSVGERRAEADVELDRPLAAAAVQHGVAADGNGEDGASTSCWRPRSPAPLVADVRRRGCCPWPARTDDRAVPPVWLPPLPDRLALARVIPTSSIRAADDGARPRRAAGAARAAGRPRPAAPGAVACWTWPGPAGTCAIIGAPQYGPQHAAPYGRGVAGPDPHAARRWRVYGMDLTGGGLRGSRGSRTSAASRRARTRTGCGGWLEELIGDARRPRAGVPGPGRSTRSPCCATQHAAGRVPELIVGRRGAAGRRGRPAAQRLRGARGPLIGDLLQRGGSFGIHLVLRHDPVERVRMAQQPLIGTRSSCG